MVTINSTDTLIVISIAILGGCLSELCSYYFVYRDTEFQKLHADAVKAFKKWKNSNLTDKHVIQLNSKKRDSPAELENEYKRKNGLVSSYRMRANIITGAISMLLLPMLYSQFEGIAVARIPFVPIWPIRMFCHTGLPGDDFTECSATFLCMTTLFITRQNLQRCLGYAPPGGSNASNPMASFLENAQSKQ